MADIGKPLERRRVFPLVEPAKPGKDEPVTPAPKVEPAREPEKVE